MHSLSEARSRYLISIAFPSLLGPCLSLATRPKAFKDQTPFTNPTHSSLFPACRQGFLRGALSAFSFFSVICHLRRSIHQHQQHHMQPAASFARYLHIHLSTYPVIRSMISLWSASPSLVTVTSLPTGTKKGVLGRLSMAT